MMTLPSDAQLCQEISRLIRKVDLETTGMKKFAKLLGQELQCDGKVLFNTKKDFLKKELTKAIEKLDDEKEQEEEADEDEDDRSGSSSESEEEEDDDDEEEKPSRKRSKNSSSSKVKGKAQPKKTKKDSSSAGGGRGGGGLAAKKEISDSLADFLGQGKQMARKDIVKALWEYIRDNDLQNPSNKREILLDEKMQQVFGCQTFTMFTMNKYIGAHIHPFKPVDLSSPSPNNKRKKKTAASASKSANKKQRKTGTQPPYRLSEDLQAVVQASVLPRPQVVSKIWDYIKAHNLQNPNDKREILCDSKLKKVMKQSKVTMFNMNKLITPHLLEKVDKSEYNHNSEEAPSDDHEDDDDDDRDDAEEEEDDD